MLEIINNWQFWGFIIQISVIIAGFCIIKFNDFKHLGEDVSQISKDLKNVSSKVTKIDKKLAVQTQRIDTLEEAKK